MANTTTTGFNKMRKTLANFLTPSSLNNKTDSFNRPRDHQSSEEESKSDQED